MRPLRRLWEAPVEHFFFLKMWNYLFRSKKIKSLSMPENRLIFGFGYLKHRKYGVFRWFLMLLKIFYRPFKNSLRNHAKQGRIKRKKFNDHKRVLECISSVFKIFLTFFVFSSSDWNFLVSKKELKSVCF